MSRWVDWGGKKWGRGLFDPPPDLPPGVCRQCGGLGVIPEQIDEERFEVAVPCYACRRYCQACRQWVKREGHACSAEARP